MSCFSLPPSLFLSPSLSLPPHLSLSISIAPSLSVSLSLCLSPSPSLSLFYVFPLSLALFPLSLSLPSCIWEVSARLHTSLRDGFIKSKCQRYHGIAKSEHPPVNCDKNKDALVQTPDMLASDLAPWDM